MVVSVASGKGGTGKTTIATSLALSLEGVQFLDCDVDEVKCTYCGKCAEACEFNATVVIKERVLVFPQLCHGCGACSYVCPTDAITEVEREIGVVEEGTAFDMEFVRGGLARG